MMLPAAVFPTPVGMDRMIFRIIGGAVSFPHTRGDGPASSPVLCDASMFSPHPWGWTATNWPPAEGKGVFPTPVGMDRTSNSRQARLRRFPHTRGDGPSDMACSISSFTFSPHPWGWTVSARLVVRLAYVFPTPVGMDRPKNRRTIETACFPHTRGDGPVNALDGDLWQAFSPHPWGWTGAP